LLTAVLNQPFSLFPYESINDQLFEAALPVEEEPVPRLVSLDQKDNLLKYSGDKASLPGLFISGVPLCAARPYFEIEIVNAGNGALPVGGPIIGLCSQCYPQDLLPGKCANFFFTTICLGLCICYFVNKTVSCWQGNDNTCRCSGSLTSRCFILFYAPVSSCRTPQFKCAENCKVV